MTESLSKKIRDLRVEKRLSQKQLAELIGVQPSTISTYESATRTPPYESLIRLAAVYGGSVDYLLGVRKSRFPDTLYDLLDENREILEKIAEILMHHRGNTYRVIYPSISQSGNVVVP